MLTKTAPEVEGQIGTGMATGPACKQMPRLFDLRMLIRKSRASKAVGPDFGVSKQAALTVVSLPQAVQGPSDITSGPDQTWPQNYRSSTILDAYRIIAQDIQAKGLARKAVVTWASAWPNTLNRMPQPGDGFAWLLYQAMNTLIVEHGVTLVVEPGNQGVSELRPKAVVIFLSFKY
jgi:hypothetical protein